MENKILHLLTYPFKSQKISKSLLAASVLVGILSGLASALFLISLEWVTQTRESNFWLIWLLPVAGLIIGISYQFYGRDIEKGNNLVLEEFQNPQNKIPLRMAPMVLIGTLLTHLCGGSAGREGTAIQMASSIADQFSNAFKNKISIDRKSLLIMGISGGFASVFGTPWAGAIFALEVIYIGKIEWKYFTLSLVSAFMAHYTCLLSPAVHTHYHFGEMPAFNINHIYYVLFLGIAAGVAAFVFTKMLKFFTQTLKYLVPTPFWRPVFGGVILTLVFAFTDSHKFIGLGVPYIEAAFHEALPVSDFFQKTVFTTFTLAAGFKGGEVTPLFYIGATLGNALHSIFDLPIYLLAAMGFVAVFSGATNTPLACTIMGVELFGIAPVLYLFFACYIAYQCSLHSSIYSSQIIHRPKLLGKKSDTFKSVRSN